MTIENENTISEEGNNEEINTTGESEIGSWTFNEGGIGGDITFSTGSTSTVDLGTYGPSVPFIVDSYSGGFSAHNGIGANFSDGGTYSINAELICLNGPVEVKEDGIRKGAMVFFDDETGELRTFDNNGNSIGIVVGKEGQLEIHNIEKVEEENKKLKKENEELKEKNKKLNKCSRSDLMDLDED